MTDQLTQGVRSDVEAAEYLGKACHLLQHELLLYAEYIAFIQRRRNDSPLHGDLDRVAAIDEIRTDHGGQLEPEFVGHIARTK